MDIVIYHAGCFDGFCAAWIAHKVYPKAQYLPYHYDGAPPDVGGKDVLILDFSFKRDVLLEMHAQAKSLLVLDHHKTAQADLAGLSFCVFDMQRSGGRLTWDHFYDHFITHGMLPEYRPWLVDYTEDRDLWRHVLPHTREINAALRTYPLDFGTWDWLDKTEGMQKRLTVEGTAIMRYQQKLIYSHVEHAAEVVLDGHKVLSVNCTCADLTSEVAGELAIGRPFGMCWFETAEGDRVHSLRSAPDGIDVSEVAKRHGGGGHKHAAGYTIRGKVSP